MEMDFKTPTANFWLLTENYRLHAPLLPSYHPGEFLDFILAPDQMYLVLLECCYVTLTLKGSLAPLQFQKIYCEFEALLPPSLVAIL